MNARTPLFEGIKWIKISQTWISKELDLQRKGRGGGERWMWEGGREGGRFTRTTAATTSVTTTNITTKATPTNISPRSSLVHYSHYPTGTSGTKNQPNLHQKTQTFTKKPKLNTQNQKRIPKPTQFKQNSRQNQYQTTKPRGTQIPNIYWKKRAFWFLPHETAEAAIVPNERPRDKHENNHRV